MRHPSLGARLGLPGEALRRRTPSSVNSMVDRASHSAKGDEDQEPQAEPDSDQPRGHLKMALFVELGGRYSNYVVELVRLLRTLT
jgi:hypothetical protein